MSKLNGKTPLKGRTGLDSLDPVKIYLDSISKHPLLSGEEEYTLCQRIYERGMATVECSYDTLAAVTICFPEIRERALNKEFEDQDISSKPARLVLYEQMFDLVKTCQEQTENGHLIAGISVFNQKMYPLKQRGVDYTHKDNQNLPFFSIEEAIRKASSAVTLIEKNRKELLGKLKREQSRHSNGYPTTSNLLTPEGEITNDIADLIKRHDQLSKATQPFVTARDSYYTSKKRML